MFSRLKVQTQVTACQMNGSTVNEWMNGDTIPNLRDEENAFSSN